MLRGLFGKNDELRGALGDADWWGEPAGGVSSWSGMQVSGLSALQMAAVYGSANLICNGISTLPTDVFRDTSGVAEDVPKPRWVEQPTVDLDFVAWCVQVLMSLLFDGNAYIRVYRSGNTIVALVPLDPATVVVSRESGRKVIRVLGVEVEVLHIKGLMWPGADKGLSPIEYARQTIGVGLSALQYGAQFFDGEGNMPGVVEAPGSMTPDEIRSLQTGWRRKRSRAGKGMPGVLTNGATWKPTGVTNEQAQFLATQKWTAAEIAGQIFLVDPSELGIPVEGSTLTYANLAQRGTRRVQVTYLPWLTRIERAISSLLPTGEYFKFNVEGLLRGDVKTQFETFAIGIESGFMTPDQIREIMDWTPMTQEAETSRAWQEVGLPALILGGLMTVNEGREQLGLPPVAGGNELLLPSSEATPAPTDPVEDDQDAA